MSSITRFMKGNKKPKANTYYAATKSLVDEKGEPLKWEIRPFSTKLDEEIKDECTTEIPIKGKPNLYRPKFDSQKYVSLMLTKSVVFPDLLNAELQNSYGVMTAEDLLKEMVDNAAEYNEFAAFVQRFNGLNIDNDELIEKVKN